MYHWWETHIPSDMCAGKHAFLYKDTCAGNILPGETRTPMTPASLVLQLAKLLLPTIIYTYTIIDMVVKLYTNSFSPDG